MGLLVPALAEWPPCTASARFDTTDGRLARIERKLDQFIDTQSKTNELVRQAADDGKGV